MPRFSANLSMLFSELPFLDRFAAAAQAGFQGIEYMGPYAYNLDELTDRLNEHGLSQVLFNLPSGNWAAGERGIACQPERRDEFQAGVGRAVEYALALGCRQVNCLAGIPVGIGEATARDTLIGNLTFAADELKQAGIRLLIEPINTRDVPGFMVNRSRQALALMADVASDNLWLQLDIYHAQVMEGDLATTLQTNLRRISHIQIADNPGRHEPGTGEINFPFLFSLLDRLEYPGWVGCEYKPLGTTAAGLGWLADARRAGVREAS